MNAATRLGVFGLAIGVVFAAAYGAGQVVGPVAADQPAPAAGGHQAGGHEASPAEADPAAHLPGGLQVSERGYTLAPLGALAGEFAFRITGPDGAPVTDFEVVHDQPMHLIAVRRDLSGFRHVHPELEPDGTWRVASPLGEAGSWRVFADFTPTGGEALTLGADVHVGGEFTPRPLPEPERSVTVDGYTITLDGTLEPGRTSRLTLTAYRDGVPVTDLQPYLGAYGHLVAIRSGDLAYLHVHPDGVPGDGITQAGPEVVFHAEVPSAGTYRLHLDFRHGGVTRTAAFTAVAGTTSTPPASDPAPEASVPAHGHTGPHSD